MTSDAAIERRRRFEDLFTQCQWSLHVYALRRAKPATALTVFGETLLVAWRRLDDAPADPLPWLYASARRVLADPKSAARLAEALTGRGIGEDRSAVARVLAALPEHDREAVMLTAWEGLGTDDAALVAGCSRLRFRLRLWRARRRLGTAMARDPVIGYTRSQDALESIRAVNPLPADMPEPAESREVAELMLEGVLRTPSNSGDDGRG